MSKPSAKKKVRKNVKTNKTPVQTAVPQQNPLRGKTAIELARMLQEMYLESARIQQNIWAINQELNWQDAEEAESGNKEVKPG